MRIRKNMNGFLMPLGGVLALAGVAYAGAASSQPAYPARPLRIITAEAGGGADLIARVVGAGLTTLLGQQVVVDNRKGGSGVIAISAAARAANDGYTLLVYNNGMWILPLLKKVPYDPQADFSPVIAVVTMPNVLVVHPALPVKTVRDLIALAKAQPGKLAFASAGPGSTTHLAGELFKSMAALDIVHVPYNGSPSALNDLMGGRVPLMFPNAASIMSHVKSGRLRAIAVTSARPSVLFPDLPTVSASGLAGYESSVTFGTFVPAGTPAAIIDRLNAVIASQLQQPEVKERFLGMGAEPAGGAPARLRDTMATETQKLGKVIKDAGIKED